MRPQQSKAETIYAQLDAMAGVRRQQPPYETLGVKMRWSTRCPPSWEDGQDPRKVGILADKATTREGGSRAFYRQSARRSLGAGSRAAGREKRRRRSLSRCSTEPVAKYVDGAAAFSYLVCCRGINGAVSKQRRTLYMALLSATNSRFSLAIGTAEEKRMRTGELEVVSWIIGFQKSPGTSVGLLLRAVIVADRDD